MAESVVTADWKAWDDLPDTEKTNIAPYCSGGFVYIPIDTTSDESTQFKFNQASIDSERNTAFQGDVKIRSSDMNAFSSQAHYKSNGPSELNGDVKIRTTEAALSGDSAQIDLETYYTLLKNAQFVLARQDMHGDAHTLERVSQNILIARNMRFSRCAPVKRPPWQLRASKLTLDNDKQIATAWHARIEVKNIPVLYVPYISFPLNDQPKSGFLVPTFGSGYFHEYYWHIAPNADDTLGLNIVDGRGTYLQNQFRFLTKHHNGENNVSFKIKESSNPKETILELTEDTPSGNEITVDDRWAVSHKQSGQLTNTVGYDINTRWVSDSKYDVDITPGASKLIEYQTANASFKTNINDIEGSIGWAYKEPTVNSPKKFTLLDTTVKAKSGPLTLTYLQQSEEIFELSDVEDKAAFSSSFSLIKRPEITAIYQSELPGSISFSQTLQHSTFTRQLPESFADVASTSLSTETERLHLSNRLTRKYSTKIAYFSPTIETFATNYRYSNLQDSTLAENEFTHLAWRGSLDQGLNLEFSTFNVGHQLQPRLYYAYAPFYEQNAPNIHTEVNDTIGLFTRSRFKNIDRIGDMSRISAGLDYRFKVGPDQRSLIHLSVKKGLKLEQERVTLATTPDEIDKDWEQEYSRWYLEANVHPTQTLSFTNQAALEHQTYIAHTLSSKVEYKPGDRSFINAKATKTDKAHILESGLYYPIWRNVALIGYLAYEGPREKPDLIDFKDKKQLVGLDFDSCCWNIRFAALKTSAVEDADGNTVWLEEHSIAPYFEFTLKGLGAGSGTIEEMLKRLKFGYTGKLFNYR